MHSLVVQIVTYTGCNDKQKNILGCCIAASFLFHTLFVPAMLAFNHKDWRRGMYEISIGRTSPVRQKRFISGITSLVS